MIEIGRVCVKIVGRDAGKKCAVVDVKDNRVLIDGETRRRFVNAMHLEPLKEILKLDKGASHNDVVDAFRPLGVRARETKPKKTAARPRVQHKPMQEQKKHSREKALKEPVKEIPAGSAKTK